MDNKFRFDIEMLNLWLQILKLHRYLVKSTGQNGCYVFFVFQHKAEMKNKIYRYTLSTD